MHIRSRASLKALVRLPYVSGLAVAALFSCISCSNSNTSRKSDLTTEISTKGTLRLYTSISAPSLNPLLSDQVLELSYLFYDTLVVSDADHRLQPRLAEIVPTRVNGGISSDGKTIRFKLRHGVTWHDGQPFSSADVAFTFAKVNDPKVNIGSRDGYDRIVGVKTPDQYTVVVTLKEPFTPIVSLIGGHYPILPKHLLAGSRDFNHDPIGAHPIGTGPYRFKSWVRGVRIDLVANETYYAGAPTIKNISVAEIPDFNTVALEMRTHKLDFGILDSQTYAELRSLPDLRTGTEPLNDVVGYALNTARPILSDVRVRQALSMAIDRKRIVANSTFGTGTVAYADLPGPLWTVHEPANRYGYNLNNANTLLDFAGWKRGPSGLRSKAGTPLKLHGIDVRSPISQSIDLQIAQMLRRVGVDLSVKYFDPARYGETKANGGPIAGGDFDIAGFQWSGGGDPENDQIYTCANRAPIGSNVAFYCSVRMDALQHDSLMTVNAARHAEDVIAIEKLAATEVPYLFLYHTPYRFVWNPALRRVHASAENEWFDVRRWSFVTR